MPFVVLGVEFPYQAGAILLALLGRSDHIPGALHRAGGGTRVAAPGPPCGELPPWAPSADQTASQIAGAVL